MKITIEVDCTPEEARAFLGFPDVAPMQAAVLEALGKRLGAGLDGMDPETLMKTWMPLGLKGMEQAQKMFWSQMGEAASGAKGGDKS